LWKLKIKGNTKYHSQIKTSGKTACHKYSENLIRELERLLKNPQYLQTCKDEYKKEVISKQQQKK
jgi:hypothetical protein